jgi:hypothetical protein
VATASPLVVDGKGGDGVELLVVDGEGVAAATNSTSLVVRVSVVTSYL